MRSRRRSASGQSADAALAKGEAKRLAKARFGGDETGANPTDRAKPGTKRSLLVEADGGPLAVVICT
ncbi:MAG: hypothetical protein JO235_00930 [Chroococcidiopsidaceae cyanobacterium CP_BM_RX_35]|nr:hypothetical protein [Chroococcidiopsidaceae cyanobacterium CP_BM_RX_35]